eukprot:Rhum_TRINITY_DN18899_c0_g1::Rhum_TRINITY_DN18899_c0_g1_i1::g.168703::m.168703/K20300/TRAPPC1, BET5; trafficking protein particle complex subunit 1
MIFSCSIFNRYGTCIFHDEYDKKGRRVRGDGAWVPTAREDDSFKLTAGLIASVKYFITSMSKSALSDGFFTFQTSAYKCHYFETQTGYRLAILTEPGVPMNAMRGPFQTIYSSIFVEKVCKDPAYQHSKHCVVTNPAFGQTLHRYLAQLPMFKSNREDK